MFDLFKKKSKYVVLPDRHYSYAVDQHGEPIATYYRRNNGLFCSTPLEENEKVFFLNIRRPIVIDVDNVAPVVIPNDLPSECDGVIFKNFGKHKITAFYVKDPSKQSMSF